MAEKIQLLEISKRKLLGQSVSCCSYDELQEIEDQLQRSLLRVRQRKAQLYMEQIDQLRSQESNLLQENAKLTERWQRSENSQVEAEEEAAPYCSSSQILEVDTELFIGLPKQGCSL
ncbi:MADS-box protein AGL42-like isoform X2 [Vigna umbellata]|uniref:MADS-box protein AGL42-like isoform X2 n=1 Tax=Vigna umbellata TaxID=87088 RepID=UPI001F5F9B39|nr:MADS-box protein AGL42-like isoform X2 [Vigna umbellata]